MRKDTRPSPALAYCKLGRVWGRGYLSKVEVLITLSHSFYYSDYTVNMSWYFLHSFSLSDQLSCDVIHKMPAAMGVASIVPRRSGIIPSAYKATGEYTWFSNSGTFSEVEFLEVLYMYCMPSTCTGCGFMQL